MKKSLLLIVAILLVGCESTPEYLAKYEPEAKVAAEKRFQFENDCNTTNSSVITSKRIEIDGVAMSFERPQYQIGVTGCDKKNLYMVNCNEDNGCTAIEN